MSLSFLTPLYEAYQPVFQDFASPNLLVRAWILFLCRLQTSHAQVHDEDREYIMVSPIPQQDFMNMYPGRKYLFDLGTAAYTF